jgi:hypothetical protein
MKQANIDGLSRFFNQVYTLNGYTVPEGPKYIATTEQEKVYLKKSKIIEQARLTPRLSMASCDFLNNRYIMAWGEDINAEAVDPDLLIFCDENAALITILLAETSIGLKRGVHPLAIVDEIYSQHTQPGYKGYDFSDIAKFLEPRFLFKVPKSSIFVGADLYQIGCYLIASTDDCINLPFSHLLQAAYRDVIISTQRKISYENISQSLTCISWKHCYLELYRCIERLFPISYLSQMKQDLGIANSLLEIASNLENTISWRPKEEEALKRLMDVCDETLRSRMKALLPKTQAPAAKEGPSAPVPEQIEATPPAAFVNSNAADEDDPENPMTKKFAGYIYKIRNQIVHFRAAHEKIDLSDELWNTILALQLHIIQFLYNNFDAEINPS